MHASSRHFTQQKSRCFARQPGRLIDQQRLHLGQSIDKAKTDFAGGTQQRMVLAEQRIKAIEGRRGKNRIKTPPLLIPFQNWCGTRVDADTGRINQTFR